MKIQTFFIVMLLFNSSLLFSQVAINDNGNSADGSAMLDVKSNTSGILIPRMTIAEIEAITSPANGLTVYNTDDCKFYVYRDCSSYWTEVALGAGIITPGGFTCGDAFFDFRDGQSYTTIQIGTQCWMAENLNIGTRINGSSNQSDNTLIEKYCYSDNTSNCDVYGGLYQWDEMMQYVTTEGTQGICPAGWHIPSDAEWTQLTDYLGGTEVAGGSMKEEGTVHWSSPNTDATNSSGFTALPGGSRAASAGFYNLLTHAYIWSSSENGSNARYRLLGYNYAQVYLPSGLHTYGYSVRCLKD